MVISFDIRKCPKELSIKDWMLTNSEVSNATKIKSKYTLDGLLNLFHEIDIPKIKDQVLNILNIRTTFINRNEPWYTGLSLTHNPDYDLRYWPEEHGLSSTPQTIGLNSFSDSLTQRYLNTVGSRIDFLRTFDKKIIRSKIAIIDGNFYPTSNSNRLGWHRDESVFFNLRINLPIQTNKEFLFQLEDSEPVNLEEGKIYSWDTEKIHRVFCRNQTSEKRIHLVIGICPWFDFDIETETWISNEYFGNIHPIDMLVEGHIHKKIKGLV